jgi:hypothetical protein
MGILEKEWSVDSDQWPERLPAASTAGVGGNGFAPEWD